MRPRTTVSLALLLAACDPTTATPPAQARWADAAPSPPGQPWFGPAGWVSPHGGTRKLHRTVETTYGPMSYTVVEPTSPIPASAPVFVYLMGNFDALPSSVSHFAYGAFEEHVARKGYVVIHPSNEYIDLPELTINDVDDVLMEVIVDALARQSDGPDGARVDPAADDEGVQLAMGGHSLGGLLAQIVADQCAAVGLPVPRALVLHDPTFTSVAAAPDNDMDPMAVENLVLPEQFDHIPADTEVVVIHGTESFFSTFGDEPAELTQRFIHEHAMSRRHLATVPDANYAFFNHPFDDHGVPVIHSDHLSVLGSPYPAVNAALMELLGVLTTSLVGPAFAAAPAVDAADWFAYHKPSVALLELAVHHRGDMRAYVLEEGSLARSMGEWSDGVPVAPMSTKSDYDPWFELDAPPSPPPEPAGGLRIGGYPVLDFGHTAVAEPLLRTIYVGNFWADAVDVVSVHIDGSGAIGFVADPPFEDPDCNAHLSGGGYLCELPLRFDAAAPGVVEAELVIEYELDGGTLEATRPLRASAG